MFEKIIQRGTLMTVIVGVVVVLGVVATLSVPVQMIPDLDVRVVQVRTSWPGATPQDIEKEILIEQEEYLRSIPSLQRIESTASSGSARIELEFPHGVDMNETLIRVNNALSQVPSYPDTVNQPRIFAEAFSSNSFMYFRVTPLDGNPRGLDMDMMRDFVSDNVRTRMENVPGVSFLSRLSTCARTRNVRASGSLTGTICEIRLSIRLPGSASRASVRGVPSRTREK